MVFAASVTDEDTGYALTAAAVAQAAALGVTSDDEVVDRGLRGLMGTVRGTTRVSIKGGRAARAAEERIRDRA